jgi:hypothetical protein
MFLLKALFASSLLLVSAPEQTSLVFMNYPLVKKVSCNEGSGTAFRVGQNHWLSVAHVTGLHECKIDGQLITVTEQDGNNDFSRLDTPAGVPNGFKVNCEGYKPGQWYWGIGHAFGRPFQTAIAVYATYARTPNGQRVLIGEYSFIPGMSGGPVLNSAGEVVGTVNAYVPGTGISISRELRDTAVCKKGVA